MLGFPRVLSLLLPGFQLESQAQLHERQLEALEEGRRRTERRVAELEKKNQRAREQHMQHMLSPQAGRPGASPAGIRYTKVLHSVTAWSQVAMAVR